MDSEIEVVPSEDLFVLSERYSLPLFFIVGGIDDDYLNSITSLSEISKGLVDDLTQLQKPFGVWAVRNLEYSKYGRAFPLTTFLNEEWPILLDLEDPLSLDTKKPTFIEMVWIMKACRRNSLDHLANLLFQKLQDSIYPSHVDSLKNITKKEEKYHLVWFDQDLPYFSEYTFKDVVALAKNKNLCTPIPIDLISTSVKLLLK